MSKLTVLDVVNDPRSHTFVEAVGKTPKAILPRMDAFTSFVERHITHRAANANGKDIIPNPLPKF